jgi:predicted nucleic acid-binding protein
LIILDNSVLSAFKRLNELRLIKELFKDVAIPTGVYEEFVRGWSPEDFPKWIAVETLSDRSVKEAEKMNLGMGEAQAIVLAKHRGCLLALDDEKAREEAEKNSIDLIGSVSILRIAYESCLIQTKERLKELLDKLAEDAYLENWLLEWVLEAKK